MTPTGRFPNLSQLSIAILESWVKPVLGEDAIKVIKEPLQQKEIHDEIGRVLQKTEKRFSAELGDTELARAVLELPYADLPSIQLAAQKFYERPTDPEFPRVLKRFLTNELPSIESERIDNAVNIYIRIMQQELISVSEEIRQKLMALALLNIEYSMKGVTADADFFKPFKENEPLVQYVRTREFETLIQEKTRNFVGRDYIFQAIDGFLQDRAFSNGYIVITGEPGIGKTALMAQLAKQRGYPVHFNIASQNIRRPRDFLENICAQLILRYGLDHPRLPEHAGQDAGFLSRLLSETAQIKGSPVVILVDAVDEAEDTQLPPNVNRLYLPQALPDGVFFVLTTRPKADYHLFIEQHREIFIDDQDPRNLEDVSEYIRRFLRTYANVMEKRIVEWKISADQFTSVLIANSEGNFMYLSYVLRDIRDGRLAGTDISGIEQLPKGLYAYYQQHWRTMRYKNPDRFDQYYQPVVCVLAAAREPVSIAHVSEWTGISSMQVQNVIRDWREFLNVRTDADGENRYYLYHASFRDFLSHEVGLKAYHGLIAKTALRKIQ